MVLEQYHKSSNNSLPTISRTRYAYCRQVIGTTKGLKPEQLPAGKYMFKGSVFPRIMKFEFWLLMVSGSELCVKNVYKLFYTPF